MKKYRSKGSLYSIESLAGQGRTATVYRALREDGAGHSRQTVALKVLKNQTAVPWLRREFETLAKVNSPHCVRVLAWENLDDRCALVLEWIDGASLYEVGRAGFFTDELVAEVVAQVQEGLRALALCQLHHGDLSPTNILIDRSGHVRIVDFASLPPEGGSLLATPAYLAPEVWKGQVPNSSSDLFALGLIAHDLRDGFSSVPNLRLGCERRAASLATDQPGLLCTNPQDRKFEAFSSRPKLKLQLGQLVMDYLGRRRTQLTATVAVQTGTALSKKWHYAACSLFAALALALPVSARAPSLAPSSVQSGVSTPRPGQLAVHTQNWFELNLNGRRLGYSPIEVHSLTPGWYRLQWRSRNHHGARRLYIDAGQTLRLTDNDLREARKH